MNKINKYLPYVQVIRRDLQLPDSLDIRIKFGEFNSFYGDVKWIPNANIAIIRISKYLSHRMILVTLLHELKHVEQYHTAKLVDLDNIQAYWNGVIYPRYTTKKRDEIRYRNQPWEVDANNYEKHVLHLFPNYQVTRVKVGQTALGTRFYRYANS